MTNPELYEKILNNEDFLNDVWNSFDQTTKIEILERAGYNLEEEYKKIQEAYEN